MTAELLERAPAKINLTLRITGRRADGYHTLESLVAFADVADELRLEPADDVSLEVDGAFAAASGAIDDNLVLKAARANGLPSGRFKLRKHIPVAAGLGGGSSDAAAALRLIARRNAIGLDDRRLLTAAQSVGADVAVCLEPRAKVMRGIGEELSASINLPELPALLVNPRVPASTKDVFAQFAAADRSKAVVDTIPADRDELIDWLADHGNDLTRAAIAVAPAIAAVLEALRGLPRCRLARMSGSGATCFALFDRADEAMTAAKQLSTMRQNWWICTATLS